MILDVYTSVFLSTQQKRGSLRDGGMILDVYTSVFLSTQQKRGSLRDGGMILDVYTSVFLSTQQTSSAGSLRLSLKFARLYKAIASTNHNKDSKIRTKIACFTDAPHAY